jgi:hypothetical protein
VRERKRAGGAVLGCELRLKRLTCGFFDKPIFNLPSKKFYLNFDQSGSGLLIDADCRLTLYWLDKVSRVFEGYYLV